MSNSKTILLWLLAVVLCISNGAFGDEKVAPKGTSEASAPAVSITFLDVEAAKAAIIDDSLDPYFDQLQAMEMSAKTGSAISGQTLEEQREQCRRRYQAGVRGFSHEEKEVIRRCVKGLLSALKQEYPLFAEMPWSFLKLSDNIEGGLSYTRDKHIILSEETCKRLTILHQSAPERAALSVGGMLVHEQMHVFQRTHPGLFDPLYTEIWGFVKAKEIESCPWLEKHHLANPDGTDCCWVFPIQQGENTIYIQPLVVFAEGEGLKRMPNDFRMIAVELVKSDGRFRPRVLKDGKPIFHNLLEVWEYCKVFPLTRNIYHPNEACASLFAHIVIFDFFTPKDKLAEARRDKIKRELAPLRKWFIENLSKKRGVRRPKEATQKLQPMRRNSTSESHGSSMLFYSRNFY